MENDGRLGGVSPSRSRGRPKKLLDNGANIVDNKMIRYYIIEKRNPSNSIVKGAADSVALFMHIKNPKDYIVIKSSNEDRVVKLNVSTYNEMVDILEKA